MIGRCCGMQTISLEEELKLIAGVPYDIDFLQDFSTIYLNNFPITDISVTDIIEFVGEFQDGFNSYVPTAKDYPCDQRFWEKADKYMRKERKREEKWKARKKPKSIEEAEANLDRIVDEILKG